MKIGIDCRLFGPKHTGIGRYTQNLVENLLELDGENEYVLFINKDFLTQSSKLITNNQNSKLKTVLVDIPHYSLKEQVLFPKIIQCENPELMHFPHFNVPVFYGGKYVVTIHDLIKHFSKGSETTTRSKRIYWLKYLGYKFVFRRAVKKAEKIITPSRFVKDQLAKEYNLNRDKIVVTYEGTDGKFQINSKFKILNSKYNIQKPYILYVGSVYPHKNIERLIEAARLVNNANTQHLSPITLVIICARNVFSGRLDKFIEQKKAKDFVRLTGFVPDEELSIFYQEAEAFIFPTLSEGFGLPGLEAMSLGCPVVCSDIPVLREVYKNAAVYFNPLDSKKIAEKIKLVLNDKKIQEKLKSLGFELVDEYSWQKMAKETLEIYISVV